MAKSSEQSRHADTQAEAAEAAEEAEKAAEVAAQKAKQAAEALCAALSALSASKAKLKGFAFPQASPKMAESSAPCRHADTEVPAHVSAGIVPPHREHELRPRSIPWHGFDPYGVIRLDTALKSALERGWPVWHTPGTGGNWPRTCAHDFSQGKVQHGARIDFCRGEVKDDLANIRWFRLYQQLTFYRAYMKCHQGPTTTNSIGNAMEQSCGVAYAAATGGEFLTQTSLAFHDAHHREAWVDVWRAYQALGFTPQVDDVQSHEC